MPLALAGAAVLFTTSPSSEPALAAESVKTSESPSPGRIANSYILGPGDLLSVELLNIPELSGTFAIGPDGTIYLPRLRALYVEGLSVDELRHFITEQFKAYVKDPQVYIKPVGYRAVRVYVGGEIERPGYYMLSGGLVLDDQIKINENIGNYAGNASVADEGSLRRPNPLTSGITTNLQIGGITSIDKGYRWPTLFDALRAAQGVTSYSDLTQVQVTRKQPVSTGGGRIRTSLNFMKLVSHGDENVNIRLFDGDVVVVGRSDIVLRDQLLAASRTNLSPDFVTVFVSGRVKVPGPKNLPQGATLNQAIASAGGPKLLRGGIEFLRFNPDGSTDRRLFSYNPSADSDTFKNPILMRGDVVRINDSIFSAGVEVLNEITGPAVGVYSIYSLFKP